MSSIFWDKRVLLKNAKKSRNIRSRAKTFKTEAKAKEHAELNNVSGYKITKMSDHKFRIDKNE